MHHSTYKFDNPKGEESTIAAETGLQSLTIFQARLRHNPVEFVCDGPNESVQHLKITSTRT